MKIFFDANVLIPEYNVNSAAFQTFARLARTHGYTLLIPHIAYLESERDYINGFKVYVDELQKFSGSIMHTYSERPEIDDASNHLQALAVAYGESLYGSKRSFNAEIAPNASQDLQLALQRVLKQQRPLNPNSPKRKSPPQPQRYPHLAVDLALRSGKKRRLRFYCR